MAIKKIMVVDDSPTERAFMEGMLKKRGYEVLLVDSGEAAIERSKSEMPDLILMDVVMPGLNGFQATRAITREEKTKHIPVIICTTKDQETDKIWGLRQGAKDYVTKPRFEIRSPREDQGAGLARHGTTNRTSRIPASVAERLRTAGARTAVSLEARLPGRGRQLVRGAAPGERGDPRSLDGAGAAHAFVVRGVANIRGNLYSMVDFLGVPGQRCDQPRHGAPRDPRLRPPLGGAGLMVSRMLGFATPSSSRPLPARPMRRRGSAARLTTPAGTRWLELDLPALVGEQRFLEVGCRRESREMAKAQAAMKPKSPSRDFFRRLASPSRSRRRGPRAHRARP
jgi:twitching motility two-component system response regulator PilH